MSNKKIGIRIIFTALIIFVSSGGINGKPPRKVVGGSNASIYDYPSVVSIQLNGGHLCGGVFITMRHILTASHCLAYNDEYQQLKFHSLDEIIVLSGSNSSVTKENIHYPEQLIVHPNYKGSPDWHGDDIGIVKLTEAVPKDATHRTIGLASSYTRSYLYGTVVGWGYLYADATRTSDLLRKAPVMSLSNENCQKISPYPIHENQLCGLYGKGVGFCDGDSGGPLFINGEVVGVVSMGYECGTGMPDIYTRVRPYVPWILSVIQQQ